MTEWVQGQSQTALDKAHRQIDFQPRGNAQLDLDVCIRDYIPVCVATIKAAEKDVPRTHSNKFRITIRAHLTKYSHELEEDIETHPCFNSEMCSTFGRKKVFGKVQAAFRTCRQNFETYVKEGSGWVLEKIELVRLVLMRYKLFSGGCHLKKLPFGLRKKKGIICLKNTEEGKCFLFAVIASLAHQERNCSRVNKKYHQLIKYFPKKFDKFPVTAKDVGEFEKLTAVSVNIYGFDDEEKVIFPYYISEFEDKPLHVDLLLHQNHYYGIKSLSSLVTSKVNRRKTFVCHFCLSYFVNVERFILHKQMCCQKLQQFVFPALGENRLKFDFFQSLLPFPFVIYADFESLILQEEKVVTGKTTSKRQHEPLAACALTVCRVQPAFSSPKPFLYVGEDCVDQLFEFLFREVARIDQILHTIAPLYMTYDDWLQFDRAEKCYMCKIPFTDEGVRKVKDHCHVSGKFRFALCSVCNISRAQIPHKICVFFHGLNNYDHHFIVSKLAKFNADNIRIVPKTSEKYLTFSLGDLNFKDSFEFLGASLSNLVQDLCSKGEESFFNVNKFFDKPEERALLYRKGVFPYNYLSSLDKLDDTCLPPKSAFFDDLAKKEITDDEYAFAQKVWQQFECENLGHYLCTYLLADVLLLADVFENFRTTSIANYDLDPVYYVSNNQYSLSAFLWYTQADLELLTDVNKYLFVSRAIRGGVAMAVKRFAQANNEKMATFKSDEAKSYILYLDCNNLYGQSMCQPLPVAKFRWVKTECIRQTKLLSHPPDAPNGYIVECDLDYPDKLHKLHSDYPVAPYHAAVTKEYLSEIAKMIAFKNGLKANDKTEKLLCTLFPRQRYVLHYRTLQLYHQLGLKITKIHRVLKFQQQAILEPYISLNTQRRAAATNVFDMNYFKLMSNSLFGKTMERPDKRVLVTLVNTIQKYEKKVGQLNLKSVFRINRNLVSIQSKYSCLKINKPIYLGMCILDLAKMFMFDFHYNVMLKYYSPLSLHLLYTDTDSLIYHVFTDDLYKDLQQMQEFFDFSNYPSDHPLFSTQKKKIPGFFKDETCGQIISSFVALKAKMYSFLLERSSGGAPEEIKTAKGVHRSILKNDLRFEHYKNCLFESSVLQHEFSNIASKAHTIYTMKQHKISLSSFDDKRYLISLVESVPYGHANYR